MLNDFDLFRRNMKQVKSEVGSNGVKVDFSANAQDPGHSAAKIAVLTKQPKGGYLPISYFTKIQNTKDVSLIGHDGESLSPEHIGLVVRYLSRYDFGFALERAFLNPLYGAKHLQRREEAIAQLKLIENSYHPTTDDAAIIAACKLVTFDSVAMGQPMTIEPYNVAVNHQTVEIIKTLLSRCSDFNNMYGAFTRCEFPFSGAFTRKTVSGFGDLLTESTLWALDVSNAPDEEDTLLLLMNYVMGLQSFDLKKEHNALTNLGIFNPRSNTTYILDLNNPIISTQLISDVAKNVIGYKAGEFSHPPLLGKFGYE